MISIVAKFSLVLALVISSTSAAAVDVRDDNNNDSSGLRGVNPTSSSMKRDPDQKRRLAGASDNYQGTVETKPPGDAIWEKRPCIPFSGVRSDQLEQPNTDESCASDGECGSGCCRAYFWLSKLCFVL